MKLSELLSGIEFSELADADEGLEIEAVTSDSRRVKPGTVFVAMRGTAFDGHMFVDDALRNGAACIVHEKPVEVPPGVCHLRVSDARQLYPLLVARLVGYPSEKLRVIGVTGTNGKTTVTLLVDSILRTAGHTSCVLGTLGTRLPLSTEQPDPLSFTGRGLTTPDAADLQSTIENCLQLGATHLVMEVSSHALDQRRVDSVHFRGRIFTNLTREHLDYHVTMENYAQVKRSFFERAEFGIPEYAVVNADDELGREILRSATCPALSFGFGEMTSLSARVTRRDLNGIECELFFRDGNDAGWPDAVTGFRTTIRSPLIGRYNVTNILAAAGTALMENVSAEDIAVGVEAVRAIPGRLERVENRRGLHVFVDYAHTQDALSNVLQTIREAAADARIICVFGCGGDRDREKRPVMGQTVAAIAHAVFVTNDNPRSEEPQQIIDEILAGIPDEARTHCTVEPDRQRAIEAALSSAKAGDVVLIAGKGHEDYQVFADRTEHFSDVEAAREFMK